MHAVAARFSTSVCTVSRWVERAADHRLDRADFSDHKSGRAWNRVGAHVECRDVRTVPLRDSFDRLQGERRVAWIDGKIRVERDRDIDEFHDRREGDNSTAAPCDCPAEVLTAEQFDLANGRAYD